MCMEVHVFCPVGHLKGVQRNRCHLMRVPTVAQTGGRRLGTMMEYHPDRAPYCRETDRWVYFATADNNSEVQEWILRRHVFSEETEDTFEGIASGEESRRSRDFREYWSTWEYPNEMRWPCRGCARNDPDHAPVEVKVKTEVKTESDDEEEEQEEEGTNPTARDVATKVKTEPEVKTEPKLKTEPSDE